jgi:tetratricopeptide (TPR) repeat protein
VAREEELWLWTGKRRQPYGWLEFEVSEELPEAGHSRRVERLVERAVELLWEGEGEEAERLLREALVWEPEAVELLQNLAMAHQQQGRLREAMERVEEIHRRWPEYLFARVVLARRNIREGKLEEARELLAPLLERRRLHPAELVALCGAQLELLWAEGDEEGAWVWLHLFASHLPEAPEVELYRVLLARRPGLLGRLKERLLGEPGAPLV